MNTLLMRLPNLLDSRVPDGDGEDDNVLVTEWGQEYFHSGEVRTNTCPTWIPRPMCVVFSRAEQMSVRVGLVRFGNCPWFPHVEPCSGCIYRVHSRTGHASLLKF